MNNKISLHNAGNTYTNSGYMSPAQTSAPSTKQAAGSSDEYISSQNSGNHTSLTALVSELDNLDKALGSKQVIGSMPKKLAFFQILKKALNLKKKIKQYIQELKDSLKEYKGKKPPFEKWVKTEKRTHAIKQEVLQEIKGLLTELKGIVSDDNPLVQALQDKYESFQAIETHENPTKQDYSKPETRNIYHMA